MILRALMLQWMATIYVGVVSLALSVFIARQIGPATFGEYSVAMTIGSLLVIFIDGGMKNLIMRERTFVTPHLTELSRRLPAIALGNALMVTLVASLLAITLFREHVALALATVGCFFGVALAQYVSAMLRGDGRLGLDARWQMAHRTLSAVCVVSVMVLGFYAPWQILAAWAFGMIAANLIWSRGLRCRPSFAFQPELYRVILPLLWIDLATVIYFRSDILVLQWFGVPDALIGQYAAVYRLIEGAIFLANPVAMLMFRNFRQADEGGRALGRRIVRSVTLAAMFGVIATVTVALFAEPIITLAYGSGYREATSLLAILAWTLIFVLPNAILTQAMLALNLERSYAWAASIAAICNVTLNIVFIARYGPQAAAWVSVMTEALLLGVLVFVLARCRSITSTGKHVSHWR